jgi:hypothetical protein
MINVLDTSWGLGIAVKSSPGSVDQFRTQRHDGVPNPEHSDLSSVGSSTAKAVNVNLIGACLIGFDA